MREIKFRGKRLDNGEWEYGDLLQYDDGSFVSENSQPPPNARWANAISNKFPDRVARGRFNSAPGSKTNTDFQLWPN